MVIRNSNNDDVEAYVKTGGTLDNWTTSGSTTDLLCEWVVCRFMESLRFTWIQIEHSNCIKMEL